MAHQDGGIESGLTHTSVEFLLDNDVLTNSKKLPLPGAAWPSATGHWVEVVSQASRPAVTVRSTLFSRGSNVCLECVTRGGRRVPVISTGVSLPRCDQHGKEGFCSYRQLVG